MFDATTTVGHKKVISCQQFHVVFGESFTLDLEIEDSILSIKFTQEFVSDKEPYLHMKATRSDSEIHYILGNFNKHQITSSLITFFAKQGKTYSFQITASCTSSEIRSTTVWLYSIVLYASELNHG